MTKLEEVQAHQRALVAKMNADIARWRADGTPGLGDLQPYTIPEGHDVFVVHDAITQRVYEVTRRLDASQEWPVGVKSAPRAS
jgi:hypothetical protein